MTSVTSVALASQADTGRSFSAVIDCNRQHQGRSPQEWLRFTGSAGQTARFLDARRPLSVTGRPGCGPDWSSVVSGLFLLEELVKVQFVKTSSHDPSVPEYFQASLSSEKDVCVKQYNGFSQDENRGLRSPEKKQQMLVLPFCVLQTRTDSIHTFTVGFLSW